MTLQQIRYFISVAESGSISEAAKRLFTAQSSISNAIKEVENTYGITAFIRESKGVRLTRSGEELLIEFKGILSRLDYLNEKFNGSKNRPLGLSVSAQHHICGMASFISVINSLNENYGEYYCGFYECRTSEVLNRVERGLDDVGIIFFTEHSKGQMIQELRNRGIIFNHIVYQTAHAYLCQDHPLAKNTEIDIEELIRYPFIAYDRAPDTNPAYTDLIIPNYQVKKVIQVSDRAAAYSAMRYCLGFAVGSGYESFDSSYSDIIALPVKNGIRLEIGWIVHQKHTLSDTASRFVELLMQNESVSQEKNKRD